MIKLSDSEWKIASKIWENGSMTITDLTKSLKDETGWSKNTIITLLNRMESKDAIYYIQEDRAKRFYTKVSREEAEIEETTFLLDKIYNGNVGLMISNLIKSDKLSEEDIEELQKLLEDT